METSLSIRQVRAVLSGYLPVAAQIVAELGDDFPDYFDPQHDAWSRNGGWTEGFWTGILWRLHEYSGDRQLLAWARHYTRILTDRKRDFTDHDLGFLYGHSCVLEHGITGDEALLPEALDAAGRLRERFNPAGRFIRAHGTLDDPTRAGYAIIDTMMNLGLLFWAHAQTGKNSFYHAAYETASTIAREYVRSDSSTYQVVWFDPETGRVEKKATLQGFGTESCWSRGQAWAIYGFARAFLATGDTTFQDLAWSLARYYLSHLPANGITPYDFLDPGLPDVPTDTSAQAIAAAGLLLLAQTAAGLARRRLQAEAAQLLLPLCDGYVAPQKTEPGRSRGFLRGGCYFLAQDRGVNSELIFGDYYFIEALMRYLALQAWP